MIEPYYLMFLFFFLVSLVYLPDYSNYLNLSAFCIFGIPHGLIDIIKIIKIAQTKTLILASFLAYILLSLVMYIAWIYIPGLFWPLFFSISLYHFTKVEIGHRKGKNPELAFYSILVLPAFKAEEFLPIMNHLGGGDFALWLISARYFSLILFVFLVFWKIIKSNFRRYDLYYYLIFSVSFTSLDLLNNFFFYFLFFHSYKHLINEHYKLFSPKNFFLCLISSGILSYMFIFFFPGLKIELSILMGVIMLTIPHVLLDARYGKA